MIISGGPRSHWRDFAPYLMRTENGHQARLVEMRGFAADNVIDAFRIMAALGTGTRSTRFYYHANINPRKDEILTEKQWEQAVDLLEKELGLSGQPRFVVEHDNGRVHRHVIWSRVDVDTMTMINQDWNYSTHQRTADALEKAFGQESTPRRRGRNGRNLENREVQRGKETGIDPNDVAAELKALWQEADTGQAFAAALAERGYILADGDRGFVVIDHAGDLHSVARRVGARLAEVNARLADIDLDSVPTVPEAKALARERAAERRDRKEVTAPDLPAADGKEKPPAAVTGREETHAPDLPAVAESQEKSPSPVTEPESPRQLSAFDRFAANTKQAMRAGGGEPSASAGWRLLADRLPSPPSRPEASPFGRFVEKVKNAMRARGGDLAAGDGMTIWQRAAAVLSDIGERVTSWVQRVYRNVSEGLSLRSQDDRDNSGFER